MGLIRKSLMVSTAGMVRGSSKKQRVAKATMKHASATAAHTAHANALLQQQATASMQLAAAEQKRADDESAFRYATDTVYRDYIDAQRAVAAQAAEARRVVAAAYAQERRAAEAQAAADRVARTQHLLGVGLGVATYFVLAVAFAGVGLLIWSMQALGSAVRGQPRQLWKREALSAAWEAAGQRIRGV